MAINPGELLVEEREVRAMPQRSLADAIGRPTQAVNEIVKAKKRITPETAVQLERVLEISAHFRLNMQSRYELVLAQNAERDRAASA